MVTRTSSLSLKNKVVDLEGARYHVIDQIDDGSYSDVYKVQRFLDQRLFAIKKIRVLQGNQAAQNHLQSELYAASKLGYHPHIVQLFETKEISSDKGSEGSKEVYLLYELCPGGNLASMIQQKKQQGRKGLSETEVFLIVTHVVQGLVYMHMQTPAIAHRDIKPENILLGQDQKWKLCDFGSSTTKTHTSINSQNRQSIDEEIRRQTTRIYQAPEQMNLFSGFPISEKVDIFGLGCLIFNMLFFKPPFDSDTDFEHQNGRYTIPEGANLSPGMTALLQKTMTQDPSQRVSSAELYSQLDFLKEMNVRPSQPIIPVNMRRSSSHKEVKKLVSSDSQQEIRPEGLRQRVMMPSYSNTMLPPSASSQNQDHFFNQFSSPVDQTQAKISNWIAQYCELSNQAPVESAFRNIANLLITQPQLTRGYFVALNQLDYSKVLVTLKAMCLIHRQMIYCPKVNALPYEKLFRREHQRWLQIMQQQLGHLGDSYRTAELTSLTCSYIEILLEKVLLVKEFGNIINTAYVLQPHTIGSNNFSQNSPIATQFLVKATRLFDKISQLGIRVLERDQSFNIRLSMAINFIEDQFLLMSLMTHLNFTFKTMFKLKQARAQINQGQQLGKIAEIISQFDNTFTRCIANFEQMLNKVRGTNELQHTLAALPSIQTQLMTTLTTLAEQETNHLWNSQSPFSELMNVHQKREGVYLPVNFEIYPNYLIQINNNWEVIIGNPKYRSVLTQKLPSDYFDNPRTISAQKKVARTQQTSPKHMDLLSLDVSPPNQKPIDQQYQQSTGAANNNMMMNQPQNQNSMGGGPGASVSEPGSGTGQSPTWEQLKAKILQAIKKDEQAEVFEALLADVLDFMTELKRTGQLNTISIALQEDAAAFFSRRNILSDSESKKALQLINNILKNQMSLMDTVQAQQLQAPIAASPKQNQQPRNQNDFPLSLMDTVQAQQMQAYAVDDRQKTPKQHLNWGEQLVENEFSKMIPRAQGNLINQERKQIKAENQVANPGGMVMGDLLDLGDTTIGGTGSKPAPDTVKDQLSSIFGESPLDSKANDDAHQTLKREIVSHEAQNRIVALIGSHDVPVDMQTHPESASNFNYKQEEQKSPLLPPQNQGNLHIGKLGSIDSFQLDVESLSDKEMSARISQTGNDLRSKFDQCDMEFERMKMAHENEELRASIAIDKLKIEQQSQAQIDEKQRQLEALQLSHSKDMQAMENLKAKLQEKISQEAIFEEQKKRAKAFMLKQQQENQLLREQNEEIKRQYEELQRFKSMEAMQLQQQQQQQNASQNSSQKSPRKSLDPSQMTQTQQASSILTEQFQMGQDHFRINIDDIRFEKQIGAGASADVFKATYKENDVAVKKLKFQNNGQDFGKNNLTKEFRREIVTLIKVRHTNLVNFMGASIDEQRGHVLILTEYCFGGTLFNLLHQQKSIELNMKQRFRMTLDIAKGMNFLHQQEPQILHRDLKSLNLLLTETITGPTDFVQCKVTDFGLSRTEEELGTMQGISGRDNQQMTGMAGTFHWMAPEVMQSETDYTHKADVYSFGIVMWEIMARDPPFKTLRPHEIISAVVVDSRRPDINAIPSNCPPQYRTIMEKCWDQNPENRPDFNIIVKLLKQIENLFTA